MYTNREYVSSDSRSATKKNVSTAWIQIGIFILEANTVCTSNQAPVLSYTHSWFVACIKKWAPFCCYRSQLFSHSLSRSVLKPYTWSRPLRICGTMKPNIANLIKGNTIKMKYVTLVTLTIFIHQNIAISFFATLRSYRWRCVQSAYI